MAPDIEQKKSEQSLLRSKVEALGDIFLSILLYGFMINYSVYFLFDMPFSLGNIFSYGTLFYLIKTELPILINSSLSRRNK